MKLALRGPMFSGKTSLAHYLVDHHGFTLINYTDVLKGMAATALCSIGFPTSVTDIKQDKETYRAFLQELGTLVGFDEGYGVEQTLAQHQVTDNIVWDCVRFLPQWEKLKGHGFTLVQLALTPLEQEQRAASRGLSPAALGKALSHPAEIGFPIQPEELVVYTGDRDIEETAAWLLRAGRHGLGQVA